MSYLECQFQLGYILTFLYWRYGVQKKILTIKLSSIKNNKQPKYIHGMFH